MIQICVPLGWIWDPLEQFCRSLIEENLPQIIDDLVNQNLNPTEVCTNIGIC